MSRTGRADEEPRLRIAFYARGLSAEPTGRGIAARRLAEEIAALDADHDVHVFAPVGVEVRGCTMHVARTGSGIADAWRFALGTARSMRALRPDVIVGTTHLLPLRLPRAVPTVVILHDVVWRDLPRTVSLARRLVRPVAERSLRRADAIVCVSGFTRERLVAHWPELGPRASVIYEAPSGRAGDPGAAAAGPAAGAPERFVLGVDTIEPRKGLETSFEAMQGLRGVDLRHCGSVGWSARELVRRAAAVDNVHLLGYVPEDELARLYRGARAAVFPSRYEGFHLSPLDALALGCPVVASSIPVHHEILGDAPEYFEPGDVEGLRAALGRVIDDEARRAAMRERGRARAARFSWQESARRLVDVVRGAIERSGASPR